MCFGNNGCGGNSCLWIILILIIIWICVSIVVSVYIYTYMMACSARFFRDALGMPSDPDEQPGTEPEITQ